MHLPRIDWHDIQWGTVPAWVSGLLSSISVILAMYIILRDRRKVEQEQIKQLVVVNERQSVKRRGKSHRITLINSSSQVFYDLGAAVYLDRKKKPFRRQPAPPSNQRWRHYRYLRQLKRLVKNGGLDTYTVMDGDEAISTLEPEQRGVIELNLSVYPTYGKIVITCIDAAGQYWLIDPATKAAIRYERFIGGVEDWG